MKAQKFSVSFIHSPPGTAKTFTLSAIAVALRVLEDALIKILAPSNVAADEIAAHIKKIDV